MTLDVVHFDCPYGVCSWPRCRNDLETSLNHPLCGSEIILAEKAVLRRFRFEPLILPPEDAGETT